MASNYLRKSIADRRTGANLIGISVDTSNMNNIAPDFKMAFDELEAFAKKADELHERNERTRISLEIAKDRLSFKEKYMQDPSVYSSQEKWDEVTRLYEEERKKAKEKILTSKYMSSVEKRLKAQEIDLDFSKTWLEPLSKRNAVVTQNRVQETMTNIEMITAIASMGDLYDTDIINNAGNSIIKEYKGLIENGIQNENDMRTVLAGELSKIEADLFKRKVQADIIDSSKYKTEDEKIQAINKAVEYLGSDERIKEVVEDMGKQWNLSDYDKKYLSVKLKEGYFKNSDISRKIIHGIEVQKKNDAILKNREIEDAVFKKDIYRIEKLTTGKGDLSTSIVLNDASGDIINRFTVGDYNISDFGDTLNGVAFPFLTTAINNEIKGEINRRSRNGNYTYAEVYAPLYENAEKLAGNDINKYSKRNAIIIDFGLRNGIDPNILLMGETNPDVFRVANSMSTGQELSRNMTFDIDKISLNKTERQNFDVIANTFSDDKILGKRLATQFLIGFISQNGSLDRFKEYPENELGRILTKNQMSTLINDAELTSKFTNSRKDYYYVEIRDPRTKKELLKETQEKKENNSKRKEAFGG